MSAFGSCTPRSVLMATGRAHSVVLLHNIVAILAVPAGGVCSGGDASLPGA
jgi:hypothetical protein